MELICPSGLTVEVRKLKGSEANVLADKKAARKGEVYDKILNACTLKVVAGGPYGIEEGKQANWDPILVCDRFYTLMGIRIATYGPEYVFPAECPDCEAKFEWEIDLTKDVMVYDLPEESIAKIAANNNRFMTEIGGHEIAFKLMRGVDERRVGRRLTKHRSELVTTAVESRILAVDGDEKSTTISQFANNLDLDLQWELLDQFEEVDGGVEQSIEIECPECFAEIGVTLPFEGEGFWIPRTRKRQKAAKRKARKTRTRTFDGARPKAEE